MLHYLDLTNPDIYQQKPWGNTRELSRVLGRDISHFSNGQPVGEVFLVSAHEDGESRFKEGHTINQIIAEEEPRINFGRATEFDQKFPLLIKILSAREKLSVQIHGIEKPEAWVTLSEGQMLYGFTNKGADLAKSYEGRGTISDRLIDSTSPAELSDIFNIINFKKYETYPIEPGMVHSLLQGTVFEVQTNENTTYRASDWGRNDPNRPLDLDNFWKHIRPESAENITATLPCRYSEQVQTILTRPKFVIREINPFKGIRLDSDYSKSYAIIGMNGNIMVKCENNSEDEIVTYSINKGDVAILPAGNATYKLTGEGNAFVCYAPNGLIENK